VRDEKKQQTVADCARVFRPRKGKTEGAKLSSVNAALCATHTHSLSNGANVSLASPALTANNGGRLSKVSCPQSKL